MRVGAIQTAFFTVNIVSVSQSHGALHHLGSQYLGLKCIRGGDAGYMAVFVLAAEHRE